MHASNFFSNFFVGGVRVSGFGFRGILGNWVLQQCTAVSCWLLVGEF